MATRIVPSLPRIKVPVGIKPMKLKAPNIENPQGRLEILRRMICRLVREERCEFKYNRAIESRMYMERLLQMAIRRGPSDPYTNEMMEWWLMEQDDLIEKLYDRLVPRFSKLSEPYTSLYRLPKIYVPTRYSRMNQQYRAIHIGVLELNGNPFPTVYPLEERRREIVMNLVKEGINEGRYR